MAAHPQDFTIGHARITDLPVLERICRDTADVGHEPMPHRRFPDLLPAVWLTPFLVMGATTALVTRPAGPSPSAGPVGYCVAAWDAATFERRLDELWWPRQRARFGSHVGEFTVDDARVWSRVEHPRHTQGPWLGDHPAVLHIDILPCAQGAGLGRRLIAAMLADLRSRGVAGVHLGVDPLNTGARAFYEHLGFATLVTADEGGPVYGMRL